MVLAKWKITAIEGVAAAFALLASSTFIVSCLPTLNAWFTQWCELSGFMIKDHFVFNPTTRIEIGIISIVNLLPCIVIDSECRLVYSTRWHHHITVILLLRLGLLIEGCLHGHLLLHRHLLHRHLLHRHLLHGHLLPHHWLLLLHHHLLLLLLHQRMLLQLLHFRVSKHRCLARLLLYTEETINEGRGSWCYLSGVSCWSAFHWELLIVGWLTLEHLILGLNWRTLLNIVVHLYCFKLFKK